MIHFFNKIASFFWPKPQIKEQDNIVQKDNNYFDIFISLDKNFNINVLIYMNDSKIESMSENETALIYYEFLNNCLTNSLQNTVVQILEKDIRDHINKNLIDKISTLVLYSQQHTDDTTFIKPSQVFTKYISDAQ